MLRITVGRGDEDYTSVQEAIDSVPFETPAEIVISEGIYHEKIFSEKSDLLIRGEGDVRIVWEDCGFEMLDRGRKRGTFRSYTAFFGGKRLRMENLSIENRAGEGKEIGQGIALYLDAEEADIRNLRIYGHQDTLFLSPLPDEEREKYGFYGPRHLVPRRRTMSRFQECVIEGTIDFIFGGGDALFDDCEIRSSGSGYVAAPSGKKDWHGMIFRRCRFTSSGTPDGSVFLMRPWRKEGKTLFLDCRFGTHIAQEGFTPWPGREQESGECLFALSSCSAEGGKTIGEGHEIPHAEIVSAAEALLGEIQYCSCSMHPSKEE